MMRIVRSVAVAMGLVGAVSLMAACSSSSGGTTNNSSGSGGITTVSIGLPTQSKGFASLYYAAASGVCDKLGVKLDLRILTPTASVAAVVGGSVNFIIGSSQVPLAALQGTTKLVFVADTGAFPGEGLYALPAIKSTPGGASAEVPALMLAHAGLTPTDYKIVYTNSLNGQYAAVASGRAQAMLTSAPLPDNLIKAGVHSIESLADDGLEYSFSNFIVGKADYVAANKSLVGKVLKCYAAGITGSRTDVDGTATAVDHYIKSGVAYAKSVSPGIVSASKISPIDPSTFVKILTTYGKNITPDKAQTEANGLIDNSIIQGAGVNVPAQSAQ
jgi:ABC-type nitrate/sulfonate/bicarbonate transport system substrate-binding protein